MLKFKTENTAATAPADPRELTAEEREELATAKADVQLKERLYRKAIEETPRDKMGRHDWRNPTLARMSTDLMIARHTLRKTTDRIRGAWERRQIPPELRD